LNRVSAQFGAVSPNDRSDDARAIVKQYVLWTALAVVAGYVVFFVL
jgi:hypothetical protein